jgi:hypothetical protein
MYIYLDEALEYFKLYNAEVENQLDKKIKRLQSDKGGEYIFNISLLENWFIVTVKYDYNKIIFVYIAFNSNNMILVKNSYR